MTKEEILIQQAKEFKEQNMKALAKLIHSAHESFKKIKKKG